MKYKKSSLAVFLTAVMAACVLCLLPLSVFAAETDSGTCGPNLTWTYNDGVLTISGTGEMSFEADMPWAGKAIRQLIIEEGVTSLCKSAFNGFFDQTPMTFTSVILPESLSYIGPAAFYFAPLTRIVLPSNVEIDSGAFYGSSLQTAVYQIGTTTIGDGLEHCDVLTELFIPSSVKTIYSDSFISDEQNLHDIYYQGSREQWQEINIISSYYESGHDVIQNATIHYNSWNASYGDESEVEETSLVYGMTGDGVLALQEKLAALGYEVGALDGYFGGMTEAAVTAFQTDYGLWVDGVAGAYTLSALDEAVNASVPPVQEEPDPPADQELSCGMTGDDVAALQQQLAALGYEVGAIDGYFGAMTEAAVYDFQNTNGLWADGVVGAQTKGALAGPPIAKQQEILPPAEPVQEPVPETGRDLVYGITGDDVAALQARLMELGYDPGVVDGYFGDYTYNAVCAFQSDYGLLVDGIVGVWTKPFLGIQ